MYTVLNRSANIGELIDKLIRVKKDQLIDKMSMTEMDNKEKD